jgi:thiol-disulfide isomerase/thioredoxin
MLLIGGGLIVFAAVAALLMVNQETLPQIPASSNSVVPAKVSFPAPELELTDLAGDPVSLGDYQGTVLLVNNWATWCPPCRAEMPVLDAYHQEHANQGFSIIAVDAGEAAADVRRFAESMALSFPVWLDPGMDAIRVFRNTSLPSSYVIDREGQVVLAWSGAISREMLEKYITPILEN